MFSHLLDSFTDSSIHDLANVSLAVFAAANPLVMALFVASFVVMLAIRITKLICQRIKARRVAAARADQPKELDDVATVIAAAPKLAPMSDPGIPVGRPPARRGYVNVPHTAARRFAPPARPSSPAPDTFLQG